MKWEGEGVELPPTVRRSIRLVRPRTANQLHAYVESVLGFVMPRRARVAGHDSPFDYLMGAYFGKASRGDAEAPPVGLWHFTALTGYWSVPGRNPIVSDCGEAEQPVSKTGLLAN